MIDWYLQTVYVLPWWAYAAPIYLLVGAFLWRIVQPIQPRMLKESHPLILVWPVALAGFTLVEFVWFSGWLLGFTDDLPPITEKLTN